MITDAQIRDGITSMLQRFEAPAVPLDDIYRRMSASRIMQPDRRPFVIGAAAAGALAVAPQSCTGRRLRNGHPHQCTKR